MTPQHTVRSTHRPAFTLVELLVVLAMLGILTALIFPTLAESRARAVETNCISNLRQVGLAFGLYVEDWADRPPRLDHLVANHVSSPNLFVCASDRWEHQGGWAWSAWGQRNTPLQAWPWPVSYGYFWFAVPAADRELWERARSYPGRPGYAVCVLHGRLLHVWRRDAAPYFGGRTHRLCFDGSVVVRSITYPGGLFNTWWAMTEQARPLPGPAWSRG